MHIYSKPGYISQMSPVDYIRYTIHKSVSTYDTWECSPDVPWRPQTSYVRVAVYQSITIRRHMIRVGTLMYGLWLARHRQKQLKARQSRQNQLYLAFSGQKQVRCEVGQSQGSWRVICTWLQIVPVFGTKVTRYTFLWQKTLMEFNIANEGRNRVGCALVCN